MPVKISRKEAYEGLYPDRMHDDSIVYEFTGMHYLEKEEVRKVFGWKKENIKDELEDSIKEGRFVSPTGLHAYYTRKNFLFIFKKAELEVDERLIGQTTLDARDLEQIIVNIKIKSI